VTLRGKTGSLPSKQVSAKFAYSTPRNLTVKRSLLVSARLRDRNPAPTARQRCYPLGQTDRASSLLVHPVSGGFPSRQRRPDRLLIFPHRLVDVLSSATRTSTMSMASSYPRDLFSVPGNEYAPLCPRSSPWRPSLQTEFGPIWRRGMRTTPPTSYSTTRTCN
jgi:hypothetical protein